MTKQIWLNLPVKDVAKAKDFFWKIGFSLMNSMTRQVRRAWW
ncbi:hypothetical protein [Flavobacterium chungangensis]|uniref:Glyoxalase n=1 Tax=Flavobacterium chungangensis TaxID=2708132 RepID=A0ABV8Z9R6_9FLAO